MRASPGRPRPHLASRARPPWRLRRSCSLPRAHAHAPHPSRLAGCRLHVCYFCLRSAAFHLTATCSSARRDDPSGPYVHAATCSRSPAWRRTARPPGHAVEAEPTVRHLAACTRGVAPQPPSPDRAARCPAAPHGFSSHLAFSHLALIPIVRNSIRRRTLSRVRETNTRRGRTHKRFCVALQLPSATFLSFYSSLFSVWLN